MTKPLCSKCRKNPATWWAAAADYYWCDPCVIASGVSALHLKPVVAKPRRKR